jgi:hypothetical protein
VVYEGSDDPVPVPVGSPLDGPAPGPLHGANEAPPSGPGPEPEHHEERFWVRTDYLMWWFKTAPTPPLLTTGTTGISGHPDTSVLVGDLGFNDRFRSGGDFRAGYHFGCLPFGIDVGYFFVEDRTGAEDVFSNGSPLLARPFFNTALGREDVQVLAAPGSPGSFHVEDLTRLWGLDGNLAVSAVGNECWSVVGLLGFRYLDLTEGLLTIDRFTTNPLVPVFGAVPAVVTDHFATRNQLYGGQIGAEAEYHLGRFFVNGRVEGILGSDHQTVLIEGSSLLTTPGGRVLLPAGRFALPTNIGNYSREEIVFVPEGAVNIGVELTRWLRIHVGYTFLYWDRVVRPGQEIDRGVNTNLVPTAVGPGGAIGAARPEFHFNNTDFWAQGLNAGLEVHF